MPILSRRSFLVALGSAAYVGRGSAQPGTPGTRAVVVVLLRGGVDALLLAPPIRDPAFARFATPASGRGGRALGLTRELGLHPGLAPIHSLFAAGQLGVVCGVGQRSRPGSHEVAQTRILHSLGVEAYVPPAPAPNLLGQLHQDMQGPPYPRSELGNRLRHAAQRIERGTAPAVQVVPSDGWDTHLPTTATEAQIEDLGHALATFHRHVGFSHDPVLVVASEFGRSVELNAAGATEDGDGGVALVLGRSAYAGRVVDAWSSVGTHARGPNGGMAVTTSLFSLLRSVVRGSRTTPPPKAPIL